jgi:hypothetical protein
MEFVRVYLPGKAGREAGPGWARIFNTDLRVAALAAEGGVDEARLAELLRPTLLEAIKAGQAAPSATAEQIADELAQRLGNG